MKPPAAEMVGNWKLLVPVLLTAAVGITGGCWWEVVPAVVALRRGGRHPNLKCRLRGPVVAEEFSRLAWGWSRLAVWLAVVHDAPPEL